ncbi:MAG: HD domain-containing protein [Coriobacteriia bacterium]|nr:HD domain-containing protein [Coriobacteriia bacterium]
MSDTAARAVTALAGARRAVQLYPPAHPAYGEALTELAVAVREAAAAEPLVLNVHQGRLYHGSLPLPDEAPGLLAVAEMFESLTIESLVFKSNFSATDAVALTEVLNSRPAPDLDLAALLAQRGVQSVAISLLEKTEEDDDTDTVRERDRAMFRRSVTAVRGMMQQVSSGDLSVVAEARSVPGPIVRRLEQDAAAVLGMAASRQPTERQLYHSINVMCYALLIGGRLGLDTESLTSLGSAALLHDIGKTAFDPDDPAQAEAMRLEHPRSGAEMLRHLALDDVAPMLVAYEHHMLADGSGYPAQCEGYATHPYTRIVSIADRFENLTGPVSETGALTMDQALVSILREASQGHFDPFLVRLFASVLGPFPVGALVRLSDHSAAVVCSPGSDPLAPIVRIAYDKRGIETVGEEEIDLAATTLHIVEVLEPISLDIDVSETL